MISENCFQLNNLKNELKSTILAWKQLAVKIINATQEHQHSKRWNILVKIMHLQNQALNSGGYSKYITVWKFKTI